MRVQFPNGNEYEVSDLIRKVLPDMVAESSMIFNHVSRNVATDNKSFNDTQYAAGQTINTPIPIIPSVQYGQFVKPEQRTQRTFQIKIDEYAGFINVPQQWGPMDKTLFMTREGFNDLYIDPCHVSLRSALEGFVFDTISGGIPDNSGVAQILIKSDGTFHSDDNEGGYTAHKILGGLSGMISSLRRNGKFTVFLNSVMHTKYIDGAIDDKTFTPSSNEEIFKEGKLPRLRGFDIKKSVDVPMHTISKDMIDLTTANPLEITAIKYTSNQADGTISLKNNGGSSITLKYRDILYSSTLKLTDPISKKATSNPFTTMVRRTKNPSHTFDMITGIETGNRYIEEFTIGAGATEEIPVTFTPIYDTTGARKDATNVNVDPINQTLQLPKANAGTNGADGCKYYMNVALTHYGTPIVNPMFSDVNNHKNTNMTDSKTGIHLKMIEGGTWNNMINSMRISALLGSGVVQENVVLIPTGI